MNIMEFAGNMDQMYQDSKSSIDEILIERIRQGDCEAFTEFYNRHRASIYFSAFHLLREEDDANDAVQELFLHVWEHADRIDGKANIKGYLYTVLRNRILTIMGRSKYLDEYIASYMAFGERSESNSEEKLLARELENLLDARVNELPPKMRQVYELSWRQQLSNKEIATRMDITEGTVKQQKHNALRILRGQLRKLLSICF